MQVLWGKSPRGKVTDEEWEHDWPILVEENEKAKKRNPAWAYFGGLIYIEDRTYQVC